MLFFIVSGVSLYWFNAEGPAVSILVATARGYDLQVLKEEIVAPRSDSESEDKDGKRRNGEKVDAPVFGESAPKGCIRRVEAWAE